MLTVFIYPNLSKTTNEPKKGKIFSKQSNNNNLWAYIFIEVSINAGMGIKPCTM